MKLKSQILFIGDLDELGNPIYEECKKCKQRITKSKVAQHNKMCGTKYGTRTNKGRFKIKHVNDKPPKTIEPDPARLTNAIYYKQNIHLGIKVR